MLVDMPDMPAPITRIRLKRFTAFESLELSPTPGINVLLGTNGTGKTHLMKVAYAACEATRPGVRFPDKLARVFLPPNSGMGRLVKRRRGGSTAHAEVWWGGVAISTSFSSRIKSPESATMQRRNWKEQKRQKKSLSSVYIPVNEMLANAPGFRSLYSERSIHFEEIYSDILDRAFLPPLSGAPDQPRRELLEKLRRALDGKVRLGNDEFFLRSRQGSLEFTLLAEGLRKLGLLWLLIQNGSLLQGSVLFWDEPETNLNPRLFGPVVEILLELQRQGVQIFIATHDYLILKQLDLQTTEEDRVAYHALYRDEAGELVCNTTNSYLGIDPNAIADAFADVYDLEIQRSLGKRK